MWSWQRAIRLPTRRLSIKLDFPSELRPVVWGMETSMTAESSAFRSPIEQFEENGRALFVWYEPDLHARYRVEWKFRAQGEHEKGGDVDSSSPSEKMAEIGILQEGDPILSAQAARFQLPEEAEDARRVIAQLVATMERVGQVHSFAKGYGDRSTAGRDRPCCGCCTYS